MREIKSIVGLRVLSVDEGANVGTVSQVVVDLASGMVLGLILGDGPGERGVLASDIQTVGTDVIMVSSRSMAKYLSELPELEARKQGSSAPLPVFTAGGRRLGTISSIFMDPYEKVVTRYEVSSGPLKDLADGVLILPILPGTVHGQDAVIVPEEQVRQLGHEAGGWRGRFGQWGETAKKQVAQVSEQAEKLYETSSETLKKEAGVVGETLKKEAVVVKQRAGELTTKTREAVSKLTDKEDAAPGQPDADDMVAVAPDKPEAEAIVPAEPEEGCGCCGGEAMAEPPAECSGADESGDKPAEQ
jgi:uncharacterized protein YrrD